MKETNVIAIYVTATNDQLPAVALIIGGKTSSLSNNKDLLGRVMPEKTFRGR